MSQTARSREQLLSELSEIFLAKGYEGATLTELSRATRLSKASLYHHFPGGKAEMAGALLRDAIARLDRSAFARLREPSPAAQRLEGFIDGFERYTDGGAQPCLVAIFAQGSVSDSHGPAIAEQYRDWTDQLTEVFEACGSKPKRAARQARALLAGLYGYLLSATLLQDPRLFRQGVKALKKTLP
jgi:AcrR family transcriptional regulator